MTKESLELALEALESSRIFVTSREKIKHPEGTDWYDERISAIKEALDNLEKQEVNNMNNSQDTKNSQPEQEPVDFEAIISDIETISCWYSGDPSYEHCPYKIKEDAANVVRRHASYYTTPPQRKPQFKEFVEWANGAGYDTALTYDTERSKWLLLSPMATDLWKAWQAAHGIKE